MKKNISPKQQDLLLSIIHRHVPGCRVYLFGIEPGNGKNSKTEINLALDNKVKIDAEIMMSLYGDIEESSLELIVDLVDVQSASRFLRQEIQDEGIEWKSTTI